MEFKKLKKSISNGSRPVLFLGAGASVSSNGLTGLDITNFVLQESYHLQDDQKAKYLFEQEYDCEATFENVMEKLFKNEKDRKIAVEGYLDQLELSDGYKYLAILLKLGYIHPLVLTTNHDGLIEKCVQEDVFLDSSKKVISLSQADLTSEYFDYQDDSIYVLHIHGSFSSISNINVTPQTTFSLSNNCKKIISDLCMRQELIMVGYGFQDADIRNLLQGMQQPCKGIYYVSYRTFNKKSQTELAKMLDFHNSMKNIIENYSFDTFFIELGKESFYAYERALGEKEIDSLFDLLDRSRSFYEDRANSLENMKELAENLFKKYPVDELLALKEFIYYEINKNGETYRLKQGIEYLEKSLERYSSFTPYNYLCKLQFYLSNEYLNLFLLGDNVSENKITYLDKIVEMGESCNKRLKKTDPLMVIKFSLLMGEALKEKAMMNQNPVLQRNNIQKAQEILNKSLELISNNGESEYYVGIAYRHLAVILELQSDLSKNDLEREEYINQWKKYSLLADEYLEKFNENTVRGYAKMNIAASNHAVLQLHSRDDHRKQLIEEGIENLQQAIKLHVCMEEYRGVAWANLHMCKLLKYKINSCTDKNELIRLIEQMEDCANVAVNNILRTDDLLGKGLAYQQLGIALSLYDTFEGREASIKIESAITILQKSVDMLKNTGFFRGLTVSCLTLSEILYKKWKATGDISYFLSAYNNMNTGFISNCENLHLDSRMETMYEYLRRETHKIIELI